MAVCAARPMGVEEEQSDCCTVTPCCNQNTVRLRVLPLHNHPPLQPARTKGLPHAQKQGATRHRQRHRAPQHVHRLGPGRAHACNEPNRPQLLCWVCLSVLAVCSPLWNELHLAQPRGVQASHCAHELLNPLPSGFVTISPHHDGLQHGQAEVQQVSKAAQALGTRPSVLRAVLAALEGQLREACSHLGCDHSD